VGKIRVIFTIRISLIKNDSDPIYPQGLRACREFPDINCPVRLTSVSTRLTQLLVAP